MSTIVVTGAGGFLGQLLVKSLSSEQKVHTVLCLDKKEPLDSLEATPKIIKKQVDITDEKQVRAALQSYAIDGVIHLAAIMSGQSEADIDNAMRINMIGAIHVMMAAANESKQPRFVFSSSIAAFGNVLYKSPHDTQLSGGAPDDKQPASTYGTAKAAVELLLANYSRKKLLDGVSLRIPIVAVRPGIPSGAASTFVSDLVREPLQGNEVTCPVDENQKVVVISPRKTVEALKRSLLEIDTSELGPSRVLVVPGLSASPKDYVDSLRRTAGEEVANRISYRKSPKVDDILSSWPSHMDSKVARKLGFTPDHSTDDIVQQFIKDYLH
eukprot:jgi/Galph1/660/GphlegSOOS_G5370.1